MSLRNDITGHVHEIHLLHRQGFCSRGEVAQAALGHFVSLLQGGNPWAERPDVECVRAIISSLLKDANEQEESREASAMSCRTHPLKLG